MAVTTDHPIEVIQIGVTTLLEQGVTYSLPTHLPYLISTVLLEGSVDELSWLTLTGVNTTGVVTPTKYVRCAIGVATILCKEATANEKAGGGPGGGLGVPIAHALTHQTGGSDVVDVKLLGGYPANTNMYLDGTGNFTIPSISTGGGLVAHHLTHEVGGTDEIANVAWETSPNTFTQDNTFNTSVSIGLIPALSGALRLENNAVIKARNAANTGDADIIGLDPSNTIQIGIGAAQVTITPVTLFTSAVVLASTSLFVLTERATPAVPGSNQAYLWLEDDGLGQSRLMARFDSGAAVVIAPQTQVSIPNHAINHEPGGIDPMAVDAAATTGSLRTIGTGPLQATAGNDARLFNARPPTAHATTHFNAGSDPVNVRFLAGYPSDGSLYLDGMGSFTIPPLPLHASRHISGGIDPIGITALAGYSGNANQFLNGGAYWSTPATQPHAATHGYGGSDPITTLSNNVTLQGAPGAGGVALRFYNPDGAADEKWWRIIDANGYLYVQAMRDDQSGLGFGQFIFTDLGNVTASGSFNERSRTPHIGWWADYTPITNPTITTVGTVLGCRYAQVGNTCILAFYFDFTVTGGTNPATIAMQLPSGLTCGPYSWCGTVMAINTGWGFMQTSPSGTTLNLMKDVKATGTWANGAYRIAGVHVFEVI